jgi:hypothetical protein
MTGAGLLTTTLVGKQLDLLREMVPRATTFAYLTDPRGTAGVDGRAEIAAAAKSHGAPRLIGGACQRMAAHVVRLPRLTLKAGRKAGH